MAAAAVGLAALPAIEGRSAAQAVTPAKSVGIRVLDPGVPRGLKSERAGTRKGGRTAGQLYLHSSAGAGAVSQNPKIYLVFWGSQWGGGGDPAGAAAALQQFFGALYGDADTWGTILSQYCSGLAVGTITCGNAGTFIVHPSSTVLAGTWFDKSAAAPKGASTKQLAVEAAAAAGHFGNITAESNYQTQYVIATPSGAHPTGFGSSYCGWHSSAATTAGTIAYTNLPYVPDLGAGACTTMTPAATLDGYFSTETHEYAETVTDLWPSNGWLTNKGSEIGDLCVSLDAYLGLPITIDGESQTVDFDVQGLWSNAKAGCVTSG